MSNDDRAEPSAAAMEREHQYAEDWFNNLDKFSSRVKAREDFARAIDQAEAAARAQALEEAAQIADNDAHTNQPDERWGYIDDRGRKYCAWQAQWTSKRIRALAAEPQP